MQTRDLLLSVCLMAGAALGHAQTVDELIAKNIAARGGAAKLHSIQTLTITGTFSLGPEVTSPITVKAKRPNQIREDFNFDGKPAARAFDGKAGWQDMPNGKGVEDLAAGALDNIREEAENAIEGPLLDYAAKGNKAEFLGKDTAGGRPCFKLKTTLKSGTTIVHYLDVETYLEVHEEIERDVNGERVVIVEDISDYREEDGLKVAHSFVSGTKEDPTRSRLTLEKFVFDAPIDASVFAKPK